MRCFGTLFLRVWLCVPFGCPRAAVGRVIAFMYVKEGTSRKETGGCIQWRMGGLGSRSRRRGQRRRRWWRAGARASTDGRRIRDPSLASGWRGRSRNDGSNDGSSSPQRVPSREWWDVVCGCSPRLLLYPAARRTCFDSQNLHVLEYKKMSKLMHAYLAHDDVHCQARLLTAPQWRVVRRSGAVPVGVRASRRLRGC